MIEILTSQKPQVNRDKLQKDVNHLLEFWDAKIEYILPNPTTLEDRLSFSVNFVIKDNNYIKLLNNSEYFENGNFKRGIFYVIAFDRIFPDITLYITENSFYDYNFNHIISLETRIYDKNREALAAVLTFLSKRLGGHICMDNSGVFPEFPKTGDFNEIINLSDLEERLERRLL